MSLLLLAQQPLGTITGSGKFLPSEAGGEVSGIGQIENIISMVLGFLTVVAGLAFLIYFIIGGLNWVTAGGDEKKVETAKNYMTNGAIGLIVIVAGYAIAWIVGNVLGIDILNPSSLPFLQPTGATTP
jgi:hypothetical protein